MTELQIPLTGLKDGETGVIIAMTASRVQHQTRQRPQWGFKRRLEDMGLTPGTEVTVVKSAPFRGPVELHVRGSRLAIGRGMAERILVRVKR